MGMLRGRIGERAPPFGNKIICGDSLVYEKDGKWFSKDTHEEMEVLTLEELMDNDEKMTTPPTPKPAREFDESRFLSLYYGEDFDAARTAVQKESSYTVQNILSAAKAYFDQDTAAFEKLEAENERLKKANDELRGIIGSDEIECRVKIDRLEAKVRELEKQVSAKEHLVESGREFMDQQEVRVKELEEALGFYASLDNKREISSIEPDPEVGHFVNTDDFETIMDKKYIGTFHGKRARAELRGRE